MYGRRMEELGPLIAKLLGQNFGGEWEVIIPVDRMEQGMIRRIEGPVDRPEPTTLGKVWQKVEIPRWAGEEDIVRAFADKARTMLPPEELEKKIEDLEARLDEKQGILDSRLSDLEIQKIDNTTTLKAAAQELTKAKMQLEQFLEGDQPLRRRHAPAVGAQGAGPPAPGRGTAPAGH